MSTHYETDWDELTFKFVVAFIDSDAGAVNELADQVSRHPDLVGVLLNLGGLAGALAIEYVSGGLPLPGEYDRDRVAAKRHVYSLLRAVGAE